MMAQASSNPFGVAESAGIRMEGGQGVDRRGQDTHRVGAPGEGGEEITEVLPDKGVVEYPLAKFVILPLVGQVPMNQEPGHLQEVRPLAEPLDRISPVAQDGTSAVNEGYGRLALGRGQEPRVQGDPSVVAEGGDQDALGSFGGFDQREIELRISDNQMGC